MATQERGIPGEEDVQALEQRLAALYCELPPGEQAALETIMAAALQSLDTAGHDTAGYVYDVDTLYQSRRLELQQAWRQADRRGPLGSPPAAEGGARGGILQPLVEFFRRAGAAQPQQRPAGQAPA